MKALNLGCGRRYHPDWTNINFTSDSVSVIAHDLSQGIPFPDDTFDVVYHSHILEHFPKSQAPTFLRECYRVLRPQGTIRISVPDLEQITRGYIFALEQALSDSPEAADNYNWLLLELFDQMVRNQRGGEMAAYLHQEHIPNESFVIKRMGIEAKNAIIGFRTQASIAVVDSWFKQTFRPVYRFMSDANYRREKIVKRLLTPKEYRDLAIGNFRQGGEIHQWMYDCYSLRMMLEGNGFIDVLQRSADESYIPNWNSFNLDTEPDGSVYKPDSLYMEAVKPAIDRSPA